MIKKNLIILPLILTLNFVFAQAQNKESEKRNHLIAKLNLLWSVAYIGSPNDGYLISLPLEYKTKKSIGLQLTTTYDHGLIVDEGDTRLVLIPEFRYYFKNHFIGLYTKSESINKTRYLHSDEWAKWTEKNQAFGAFYGYQKELGRLILEGQIGAGIRFNIGNSARSMNYPYPTIDRNPSLDLLLALHVGWRIF